MEPEKGNRISVLRMKQQWIQRKQHNYSGAQNRAVEEFSETEDSSGTQNGDMVGLKKERFDSHNIVMVELEKEGGGYSELENKEVIIGYSDWSYIGE